MILPKVELSDINIEKLSKEKMGRSKKQPRFTAGDQTCLALSLTAAFATMVSAPAKAVTVSGSATIVGSTTNVSWTGSGTLLINSGVIVSGTPALSVSTSNGIVQNNGTLSGSTAVSNTGLMTALNNGNGTGIGSSITGGTGIDNAANGTITTLHNFSGSRITAITGIKSRGTIGTLTNDSGGSISNGGTGVFNYSGGTIGTLSNSGLISQASFGINNNNATITTLQNGAGGTINGVTAIQNNNSGSIGTLTNTGFINANGAGIANIGNSTIVTLNNGGSISAPTAISNDAAIGTLTNTGTITGTQAAISNTGTIGVIANNGGVISGEIVNTTQPLSLTGGSGTTFGTLTGAGSGIGAGNIGLITNTASNLTFGAGNQLLNDHVNVGTNTVFNAGGTLQVNNAITITGNYSQSAGATLNIGVADGAVATGVASSDSGYGRLIVSGTATFNAGASIALKKLNSYGFAQGQRFVVAQASHANTNYNAGSLNYSADGYTGTYSGASVVDSDDNTKTDLVVTLAAPATGTNPGSTPGGNSPGSTPGGTSPGTNPGATSPIMWATTPDAISALSGLFRYGGTNAGMLNMFNAAAALDSAGDANRAGAQLSPASITASAVQSAQTTTQAVLNITASRIDTLRTAQSAGSGVSTGESASDIALWGQAFGGQANQGNRSGASGYRASYGGLLIGADTALNDAWRVGGVFNYADTSVDGRDDNTGSSARIKAYGLTGYGGYTAERWYLNLASGIVWQKYDTHRSVDYTGFSGNAAGRFNGTQYIASAQAGYPIKLDAVTTLTPIVGLSYSRMTQDAYTETGGVAALRVSSSNASSVKSELGAKLARTFTTSYGEITPSIQLSWRHEYLDTSIQSIANFAADTSGATSFITQGALANRDTGVMVLGATLARSQNLTLAVRYTLEASRGYTAQTADLRLRYQF